MRGFNMSANLDEFSALAIAIVHAGRCGCGAWKHRLLAHDPTAGKLPRSHTIYRAVREVPVSVTSGIVIIITVFLLLLTLQDLEGNSLLCRPGHRSLHWQARCRCR